MPGGDEQEKLAERDDLRAKAEAATPGPWWRVKGDLEGKPASGYRRPRVIEPGPEQVAELDAVRREAKAEALREFADGFRPGDGNPWALHVRQRARRVADRIESGGRA